MEALLGPDQNPLLHHPRGSRFKNTLSQAHDLRLPHRWYYVLSLHLAGKTAKEVAELTGYTESTIHQILQRDKVIRVRQFLLSQVSNEFEALYGQVVEAIRDGLNCADLKVRLEAAEKWLKSHGKYKGDSAGVNVTAEDVVIQILNQGSR